MAMAFDLTADANIKKRIADLRSAIGRTPVGEDPQDKYNLSAFNAELRSLLPQENNALINSLFSSMAPSPAGDAAPSSDKYFQDLLASVAGPSSTEEALKLAEGQGLEQLLAEIDRGTAGDVASLRLDFLDRGIGGPGQVSDIEANAIAQLQAGGARTKSGARTSVLTNQLGRLAEREKARTSALGLRYQTGAAAEESAAARRSAEGMNFMNQVLDYAMKSGALSQEDAQFYAKLMSTEKENALGRTAAYNNALLGTRGKERDLLDYIQGGTGVFKDLFGGGDTSSMSGLASLFA